MLVYANHLTVQGRGAEEAVFRAIGSWLKQQMGRGLSPDSLRRDGEYDGSRGETKIRLRIYATEQDEPRLYAWILKFPDERVWGRQWAVEIGVKLESGLLELSCVVKTDERSTLVSDPVTASQPRLIRYVAENVMQASDSDFTDSVAGLLLRTIGEDLDSYRAFQYEIDDRQRTCPIVLVSPTSDGEYLVDVERLQPRLIGLAQVVRVSRDFNRFDMARILGQPHSAWGGAINVLDAPTQSGFVRARLFLSSETEAWSDAGCSDGQVTEKRISTILAWVTNSTNMLRLRHHIRPEGVMRLALRRQLHATRERSAEMDAAQLRLELGAAYEKLEEQDEFFDEVVERNRQLENQVLDLEGQVIAKDDEVASKEYQIQGLRTSLAYNGNGRASGFDSEGLLELASRTAEPSPSECLEWIERVYGDRCTVLSSAKKSAEDAARFREGRWLLGLLSRLTTEYRDALMKGGDTLARKVFGKSEFAATESETVMGNKDKLRQRTFEYDGSPVEMLRHLKIGVDDDIAKTIRVHFHWDSDRERIVIGYCGKHLSVSSR